MSELESHLAQCLIDGKCGIALGPRHEEATKSLLNILNQDSMEVSMGTTRIGDNEASVVVMLGYQVVVINDVVSIDFLHQLYGMDNVAEVVCPYGGNGNMLAVGAFIYGVAFNVS